MSSFQRCFLRLFHCRVPRRETRVVVGCGHIMPNDLKRLLIVGARAARRLPACQICAGRCCRGVAPFTTMLTRRLPHWPHTSLAAQSGTVVSAPKHSAISAGSGSTRWPQSRHQTTIRAPAAAVLPSVAGGPWSDFI
jgi:hypothetical protein